LKEKLLNWGAACLVFKEPKETFFKGP